MSAKALKIVTIAGYTLCVVIIGAVGVAVANPDLIHWNRKAGPQILHETIVLDSDEPATEPIKVDEPARAESAPKGTRPKIVFRRQEPPPNLATKYPSLFAPQPTPAPIRNSLFERAALVDYGLTEDQVVEPITKPERDQIKRERRCRFTRKPGPCPPGRSPRSATNVPFPHDKGRVVPKMKYHKLPVSESSSGDVSDDYVVVNEEANVPFPETETDASKKKKAESCVKP